MKKITVIFLSLLMACAICSTLIGCGATASEGLQFKDLTESTVAVTGLGTCQDKNVVIPETVDGKTVVKIDEYAFSQTDITGVVIPKTVIEIGNRAFSECNALKEITLLSGVTYGENVYLGSGIKKVTVEDGVTDISKNLFAGATYLTEITFASSVTKISDGAFSYSGITSVTVPDSVTEIGDNAFRGSKIEIAIIPTTVTKMGEKVFADCSDLIFITLNANERPAGWSTEWCSDLDGNTVDGEIVWGGHVHKYEFLSEKKPTCIMGGNVVYKCADCNRERTVLLPLDENGHVSEGDEWQTDLSSHKKFCKYCRQYFNYGYHEFENGQCTVCGKNE